MAFDTYMQIGTGAGADPIGESTAANLTGPGWIEIFSFSWGASNPTTVGSGKAGLSAGKVSISSFNIMKKSELSSCTLFQACCSGQHYTKAVVVMRKAAGKAGKQSIFIQYDFTDVMVESVQWSGSSGAMIRRPNRSASPSRKSRSRTTSRTRVPAQSRPLTMRPGI
jgi:type VI secretion system secreted protein Hcp